MKREHKILVSFASLLLLFVLAITFKNNRRHENIKFERMVFDGKLEKFDSNVFERVIPYINKMVDHYGHNTIKSEGYSDIVREFDESVKRYTLSRKPENFRYICEVLEEIRRKNLVDTLKELIKVGACPLTLLIYFLSPLPTGFMSNSQVEMFNSKAIMNDKVLKYMAVLRLANVNRGIYTMLAWFEAYDHDEQFKRDFGNVLSYPMEQRNFASLLPDLKLSENSTFSFDNFDELLKMSKADLQTVQLQSKLRLDLSLEHYLIASKSLSEHSKVLVVKTPLECAHYFTQISESILINDSEYHLKAMIVQRNNRPVIIVFDDIFQFWSMFEGETVLSIPRPFARKYFIQYGTHLIYLKQ